MFRLFSKLVFKIAGWRVEGEFPSDIKKYICIVGPHTSAWDFVMSVLARSLLGVKSSYLGKSQLFKWPYGILFRALGGNPVYRDRSNNLVDQVAELFDKKEEFVIALAPEGTRKKVDKIKTGFYHIAVKANVPIVMVGMDYHQKFFEIRKPFYPSGVLEKDMPQIIEYLSKFKGKNEEDGITLDTTY